MTSRDLQLEWSKAAVRLIDKAPTAGAFVINERGFDRLLGAGRLASAMLAYAHKCRKLERELLPACRANLAPYQRSPGDIPNNANARRAKED